MSAPPIAPAPTTALRTDLLVLVGAAVAVQVVFPYRHDWPAHLLGGGGAMLLVAALAPRAVHRATALAGFAVVLGLACVTEARVFGPLDLVDISYTLAGGVVMFQATDRIGSAAGRARGDAASWGAALIIVGLAYRYGTSIGPA